MNLCQLGWNETLQKELLCYEFSNFSVGRVSLEHKNMYRVLTDQGELLAEVSGKFRFEALDTGDYPAVGDWVLISVMAEERRAIIHKLFTRFSKFSRKVAGRATEEQIIASNINTVFLVNALNNDFNIRRIERYLLMTWESGANPVIVLTKADLCRQDISEKVIQVEEVAFGVPIHVCSALDGTGIEELQDYFISGQTVALLGSSGAGKSTLTNRLLGVEKQLVQETRKVDDKGRHTTTHRELFLLPGGGIIIDTPGLRELQFWETENSLSKSFSDIEEISNRCSFNDCQHESEPGCAIKAAINEGALDIKRFQSYLKLQKELAYFDRKSDVRAQLDEKEKWKRVSKGIKSKRR
ncbi:ribosome small subunit-dependent GTPase A [Sutcliffiella cohnii]|uniref:Small ribosomal subunit biogenesis GTPase RsgA n=1 Tax=Sutcliffiella cohnii TaxID=33932 RepID=A0A223KVU6_9BACI|nr:ribosome small subunit-dependent GTPase A [Sutcliffiella cohnii]AST93581.1 ribosome small subunit-dependent GTPase A [Sutcliffiella cohnii]